MNEEYCAKCYLKECGCAEDSSVNSSELKFICNSCDMQVDEVNQENLCVACG